MIFSSSSNLPFSDSLKGWNSRFARFLSSFHFLDTFCPYLSLMALASHHFLGFLAAVPCGTTQLHSGCVQEGWVAPDLTAASTQKSSLAIWLQAPNWTAAMCCFNFTSSAVLGFLGGYRPDLVRFLRMLMEACTSACSTQAKAGIGWYLISQPG